VFQAHANRSRDSTNLLCPGRNPDYSTRIPSVKKEFELVTKTKQARCLHLRLLVRALVAETSISSNQSLFSTKHSQKNAKSCENSIDMPEATI